MSRTLRGSKKDLPGGLEPMEWASEIFNLMDEGVSEEKARQQVKEKYKEKGNDTSIR